MKKRLYPMSRIKVIREIFWVFEVGEGEKEAEMVKLGKELAKKGGKSRKFLNLDQTDLARTEDNNLVLEEGEIMAF
jgi:hypothetical protein